MDTQTPTDINERLDLIEEKLDQILASLETPVIISEEDKLYQGLMPMLESFAAVQDMVNGFKDSPMAQMIPGLMGGDDGEINMLSKE